MIRVRACTMRCRCHSSCRRSRFSQLGTQIGGKSSFSINPRICCASCRSVFCLRPRLRRISYPQLELQLRQQLFEPACVSAGLHPHTHLPTASRQSTVELLRPLAVRESLLLQLSGFCIDKSNLLEARMVIAPYNDHVRLLSPSLLVGFAPPTLLRALEPTLSWNQLHSSSERADVKLVVRSRNLSVYRPVSVEKLIRRK